MPSLVQMISEVPERSMMESEGRRKLRYAQKTLHRLLEPEIAKLCDALQLPVSISISIPPSLPLFFVLNIYIHNFFFSNNSFIFKLTFQKKKEVRWVIGIRLGFAPQSVLCSIPLTWFTCAMCVWVVCVPWGTSPVSYSGYYHRGYPHQPKKKKEKKVLYLKHVLFGIRP